MARDFVALDFENDDFGPKLRRCLAEGIPVFFYIRGRSTARLRELLNGETFADWTRLAGIVPLNRLCVAISLALTHSMHYRVLPDHDTYGVEFFLKQPQEN